MTVENGPRGHSKAKVGSTPTHEVIRDPGPSVTGRPRANPKAPQPAPIVVDLKTPAPPKPPAAKGHSISGQASWYCRAGVSVCHYQYPDTAGFDAYAAAGPALRRAIGPGWRGNVVTVQANGRSVRLRLIDWCGCPNGRVVDLYYDVARALGISGVGRVTIRWN